MEIVQLKFCAKCDRLLTIDRSLLSRFYRVFVIEGWHLLRYKRIYKQKNSCVKLKVYGSQCVCRVLSQFVHVPYSSTGCLNVLKL